MGRLSSFGLLCTLLFSSAPAHSRDLDLSANNLMPACRLSSVGAAVPTREPQVIHNGGLCTGIVAAIGLHRNDPSSTGSWSGPSAPARP
jgi:hypothetical protein